MTRPLVQWMPDTRRPRPVEITVEAPEFEVELTSQGHDYLAKHDREPSRFGMAMAILAVAVIGFSLIGSAL